jgi:hypothetical protein
MPVNRVVAKVRGAVDKPSRERWLTEITHLIKRLLPMNRLGLLRPKAFTLFQMPDDRIPKTELACSWEEWARLSSEVRGEAIQEFGSSGFFCRDDA